MPLTQHQLAPKSSFKVFLHKKISSQKCILPEGMIFISLVLLVQQKKNVQNKKKVISNGNRTEQEKFQYTTMQRERDPLRLFSSFLQCASHLNFFRRYFFRKKTTRTQKLRPDRGRCARRARASPWAPFFDSCVHRNRHFQNSYRLAPSIEAALVVTSNFQLLDVCFMAPYTPPQLVGCILGLVDVFWV